MPRVAAFIVLVAMIMFAMPSFARDAGRDLRRLVGYCIIDATEVSETLDSGGDKYVKLSNGYTFKVNFLLLDPLPLTDVIVFARPMSKELTDKYRGKLPEIMLYSIKLFIDNEIVDAEPVTR
jgi:hypothetical protein